MAWCVAMVATAELAVAADRPNVLILFIDDLGCRDVGVDGSLFHETPRLDALARAGVRFTDFYSSHPVCSPTRAALMTGKAPQRVGITDWIHPNSGVALSKDETTLGEAFQAHGYQTAYLGKWHLGEADKDFPTQHGFEWTRGVNRAGAPGSYHYPYRRPGRAATIWDVPDFDDGQPGDYLTDVLTTAAIDFLDSRDAQRPFLLCLGHYVIHTPIQPPAELPSKYQAKREQLYGDSETPTRPAPNKAISRGRQDNPDYAAMMENLDTNVGRLLDALKQRGLGDNTIVVFTSDNGGLCTLARGNPGPTCNLPLRSGKGWTYEGGIRIPTFVTWPAQLRPAVSTVPGYTADLYPTLLELCGLPLKPEQHLDGRSLAGVLRGEADPSLDNRPLGWYYPHNHGSGHQPSAALRMGPWKLIHFFETDRDELYDLAADPGENSDLSSQHPAKTAELRTLLLEWVEATTP